MCFIYGVKHPTTHMNRLQEFQSKVFRMVVNASWFVRNFQIHNEVEVSTIQEFIQEWESKSFYNADVIDLFVNWEITIKKNHVYRVFQFRCELTSKRFTQLLVKLLRQIQ